VHQQQRRAVISDDRVLTQVTGLNVAAAKRAGEPCFEVPQWTVLCGDVLRVSPDRMALRLRDGGHVRIFQTTDVLAIPKNSSPCPGTWPTFRTRSVPAGGSVEVAFPIPPACCNPDCNFRIIVDSASQITESDDTNNIASGTCPG
jgi:hypothetical protein